MTAPSSLAQCAPIFNVDEHVFEIPAKLIKNTQDMRIWERSEAYFEYLGFILAINSALKGKSNSQARENPSETVLKVLNLLDELDKLIDETPPLEQPQRFGNQAFRIWYERVRNESMHYLQRVLPEALHKAIPEIVVYLIDGFGNSTRIDYGTGHEISFLMFLCSLFKIGVLHDSDKQATGGFIFTKYLELVRKLQQTYRMEPAGSHGVWSLDDYQFVPFIWGSSQLYSHPRVNPSSFLHKDSLKRYGDEFMFLECIKYINSVKTGPFAEHSNQLWSISGVSSWSKINGGLIKMYKVEVLGKFPVIQHMVFGSLFTLKAVEQSSGLMAAKTSVVLPPSRLDEPISSSSSQSESELSGRTKSVASGHESKSSKSSETEMAVVAGTVTSGSGSWASGDTGGRSPESRGSAASHQSEGTPEADQTSKGSGATDESGGTPGTDGENVDG